MKRLLSFLACAVMVFSVMPVASAEEATAPEATHPIVSTLEELQAAISETPDGGTILIADTIGFTDSTYSIGADTKTITIKPTADFQSDSLFYIQTFSGLNIHIQNIVFDGDQKDIHALYGLSDFPDDHSITVTIEQSTFQNFNARAIRLFYGNLDIEQCSFSDNKGQGHLILGKGVTADFADCTFTNGWSSGDGGAVFNYGNITFNGCKMLDNIAGYQSSVNKGGGAICNSWPGQCIITDCEIIDNTAQAAGAIMNNNGTVQISDSMIYGNTATACGNDLAGMISVSYSEDFDWGETIPSGWYEDFLESRFHPENNITRCRGLNLDGSTGGHLRFVFENEIENGSDDEDGTLPDTPDDDSTDTTPPEQGEDNPGTSTPPDDDSDTEPVIPDNGNDAEDMEDNKDEEDTPTHNDRPTRPRPSRPIIIVPTPAEPEIVFSCNVAVLDTSTPLALAGYGDGLLHEEDPLTRAQAAQLLYRLLTKESRETLYRTGNNFNDVAPTAWYNEAVSTIANAGIVVGYGESYHPDDHLTWAQLLTILSRFVEQESNIVLERISAADHWAYSSIKTAVYHGWIEDTATFEPDKPIKRGEAVNIINTALGH